MQNLEVAFGLAALIHMVSRPRELKSRNETPLLDLCFTAVDYMTVVISAIGESGLSLIHI